MRNLAILVFTLVLAACASTTPYGPAGNGQYGYTEQPIEQDRYRVSYKARAVDEAESGALRRAAELTLQQGYTTFTVVSRSTDREIVRSSGTSVGIGGGTGSRNTGVGIGVSLPLGGGGSGGDATTRLEIVMSNQTERASPNVYDANATLTNLRGAFASDT